MFRRVATNLPTRKLSTTTNNFVRASRSLRPTVTRPSLNITENHHFTMTPPSRIRQNTLPHGLRSPANAGTIPTVRRNHSNFHGNNNMIASSSVRRKELENKLQEKISIINSTTERYPSPFNTTRKKDIVGNLQLLLDMSKRKSEIDKDFLKNTLSSGSDFSPEFSKLLAKDVRELASIILNIENHTGRVNKDTQKPADHLRIAHAVSRHREVAETLAIAEEELQENLRIFSKKLKNKKAELKKCKSACEKGNIAFTLVNPEAIRIKEEIKSLKTEMKKKLAKVEELRKLDKQYYQEIYHDPNAPDNYLSGLKISWEEEKKMQATPTPWPEHRNRGSHRKETAKPGINKVQPQITRNFHSDARAGAIASMENKELMGMVARFNQSGCFDNGNIPTPETNLLGVKLTRAARNSPNLVTSK